MSEQVQLYIIVAGVVIIALVFGRRLLFKWKGASIETGRGGGSMNMSAKGPGSSIKNASQKGGSGSNDDLNMAARGGGQLDNVHQDKSKKG